MAEDGGEELPDIRKRLWDARQTKVRYGRATLTVYRWGGVLMSPIHDALTALQEGDGTAEDVAWAFVRQRVKETSPTFDWETADLVKLIGLVVGVSRSPVIEARSPEVLARELQELADEEAESLKRSQAAIKKIFRNPMADYSKTLSKLYGFQDITKQISAMPSLASALSKMTMPKYEMLALGLAASTPNFPDVTKAFETSALGRGYWIDPKVFRTAGTPNQSLTSMFGDQALSNLLGAQVNALDGMFQVRDWQGIASQLADAATTVSEAEAVEALELGAEVVNGPEPPDLYAFAEKMRPMFESLEKAVREAGEGDSTTKQVFIALVVLLIWTMIQQYVAAKFGVYLTAPEPPPP